MKTVYTENDLKVGNLARRLRKFFAWSKRPLCKHKAGVKTKNLLRSQRSQKPTFGSFSVCLVLAVASMLLTACEKKEATLAPRCIYDQSIFAAAAFVAASNDEAFARFKRNSFLNLLWENLSQEEGNKWLEIIQSQYPFLEEKLEQIRISDTVGSPRVFEYAKAGVFSPATLRLTAIAGELHSKLGSWKGLHVVQIGAGYGGLCKVMHAIAEFSSYTLVDLPEQLALAKKYLESFRLNNITYLTPHELVKTARYDLVVSDRSFSEFDRAHQDVFFERVLCRSRCGFLVGRVLPKHYGVIPWNVDHWKVRFEKKGNLEYWEMQEPSIEQENYLICFKHKN